MKNFLFDVKVVVTIRLDAEDEAAARAKLSDQLHNEEWTMLASAELVEVDGECPGATRVEAEEEATQAGLYQA